MASFLLLPSPCSIFLKSGDSRAGISNSGSISTKFIKNPRFSVVSPRASASIDSDNGNGGIESPKPRRGRKKKVAETEVAEEVVTPPKLKRGRKKKIEISSIEATSTVKTPIEATSTGKSPIKDEEELWDYDDGMDDIPYLNPPLVCCFGAAKKEFVPMVRVSEHHFHPDRYSEWKMLQLDPPEFAMAPGGPSCGVAIALVRMGGRAEFMGKVGTDELGLDLLKMLYKEKVQTRAVKFEENSKTATTYLKVKFQDGKMMAEPVKQAAEESFSSSELYLATLKEARIFHFNSDVLTIPSMRTALYKAIAWSKKFGGLIFFDPNLPLPLWKSRDETRELIDKAWKAANIIEVSRHELEFLLDEEYYLKKRTIMPQYYAEDFDQLKGLRKFYHLTREEIAPLWHDGIKCLFVTDGTQRIHYYTPSFDGVVIGLEDVLISPETCDRTGSGDAMVAAIIRKLTTEPELLENQDFLERQLRFVIAAGVIAQWTIGSTKGLPTEGAAQNLKEQVWIPSMW